MKKRRATGASRSYLCPMLSKQVKCLPKKRAEESRFLKRISISPCRHDLAVDVGA